MRFPSTVGAEVFIFSDFLGAAIDPAFAGVAENSGTAALKVAQEGGLVELITGTTSGNRAHVSTGLNHTPSNGSIIGRFRVKSVTAVTNRAIFVGFTDSVAQEMPIEINGTTITSTATNAVGFVYDTDATTDIWYFLSVNADTDKAALVPVPNFFTGQAPVADTWQNFGIEITPDGDAIAFFGTGDKRKLVEVARIEDAVATTSLLTPIVAVETSATGARTVYVDYMGVLSGRAD